MRSDLVTTVPRGAHLGGRPPRRADVALRLADHRLYAQKHSSELARTRPHEVLLPALSEREPNLLEHSHGVARLSLGVADRLRLSEDERSELRIAAELHDVGKLAVPHAILAKAGPLTADELEFIHRHTVIGERIVAATPALQNVARIVRASHEQWDGGGYPDGLAGHEIPLAAHIIAVCDAFKAMTTERPYGMMMSVEGAMAELARCAGTQFDPGVVAAFTQSVAARALARHVRPAAARRPGLARCSPSGLALPVATPASSACCSRSAGCARG